MQQETTSDSGTGRQAPPRPTASPFRRLRQSSTVGVICAVALFIAALWVAWKMMNQPPPPAPPGQVIYIRDIYVILDTTASMKGGKKGEEKGGDIDAAKKIITSRIFPNVGPGDRVFCYGIGDGFKESRDRIFGQKALPGVPENLLDKKLAGRVPPEVTAGTWQEVSVTIDDWSKSLDQVNTNAAYLKLSSYYDAFAYIADRIRAQKDTPLRERLLIVIGDLYQDPITKPFQPPEPTPQDKSAFDGTEVRLIYSYQSGKKWPLQPAELEQFWQKYFTQRGSAQVLITTFDDPTPPLPQSPVPRPAKEQNLNVLAGGAIR